MILGGQPLLKHKYTVCVTLTWSLAVNHFWSINILLVFFLQWNIIFEIRKQVNLSTCIYLPLHVSLNPEGGRQMGSWDIIRGSTQWMITNTFSKTLKQLQSGRKTGWCASIQISITQKQTPIQFTLNFTAILYKKKKTDSIKYLGVSNGISISITLPQKPANHQIFCTITWR